MSTYSRLVIFHLARVDGTSLFLHPMNRPDVMLALSEELTVQGVYGNEPAVSALHEFREELYRCLEDSVLRWSLERSFLVRFVAAAASFMAAYFVFALFIRLALAFQILGPLAVAVGVHRFLGAQLARSKRSEEKRQQLREQIDRIVFNEHGFVYRLEERLHRFELQASEAMIEDLLGGRAELVIHDHEHDLAERFAELLSQRFRSAEQRRKLRKLTKVAEEAREHNSAHKSSEAIQREIETVTSWAGKAAVDLPLLALLVMVRVELRELNRSPAG